MSTPEDIGTFHGTETDFSKEYHEARRMMGLRSTDMEALFYNVGLLYLNAPDKWIDPFLNLMDEIQLRIEMLTRLAG